MATIDSVKLPDNSTYDLTDNYSGYQKQTLTAPITVDGTSETTVEDALDGLNDYGDALADNLAANENVYGAKNENAYPYEDTTKIDSGITFINNGDGSVTVSGTAGANIAFNCHHVTRLTLPTGKHKINGCPAGGSGAWYINITEYINGVYSDNYSVDENGLEITADNTKSYGVYVWVASGTVISTPITFYPMFRDARVVDDTFVPYAPTNREAMSFKANGKVGAKNIIPYPYYETSKSENGLTFTDNGDGSITIGGTASANTSFILRNFDMPIKKGTYIMTDGANNASVVLVLYDGLYHRANTPFVEVNDVTGANLALSIESGTVISTPITVYPMIRIAEDTDETYQPFAKTNKQLTDDKAERDDLSTIHATGSTNTTGATIADGTFFYLNGVYCKALTDIAANATFTENTNYEEDTAGNNLVKIKEIQIPAADFGTFPLNASGYAFPHTILEYTGIAKERIISIMQINTYVVNGFFSYEMYGNNLYVMASKTDAGDYTYLNAANATLRIAYI